MKKFYNLVTVFADGGGWQVLLDGKPVQTPVRQKLTLPSGGLANAVADEWRAQDKDIIPASMPLTQLAMTAIDRVPEQRVAIIATLVEFAAHDLLCYRVQHPADLVARQQAIWDPVVALLRDRHGFDLVVSDHLGAIAQPAVTGAKITSWLESCNDWQLSALQVLIPSLGSVGLACGVFHGWLAAADACQAALLEESFQAERWGDDADAISRRAAIAQEVANCDQFLRLISSVPQ